MPDTVSLPGSASTAIGPDDRIETVGGEWDGSTDLATHPLLDELALLPVLRQADDA